VEVTRVALPGPATIAARLDIRLVTAPSVEPLFATTVDRMAI